MQKNKMIELNNISLSYPTNDEPFVALADVDLSIDEGEFVCVLGPSGCGKSTLLNIIAGLKPPTEGVATMFGEPITGTDWHRAVVFQTAALYPWLDVYDNIAFGPKMRGVKEAEIERLTDKYLELVGLTDFAESKIYELSGGMKQRVQLARVLINQPNMILMDEPFGALDALTRANMQDLIRGIWLKTKSTVFLITHDVDEALSLGTRVVVMATRPGRVVDSFDIDYTYRINEGEKNCQYSSDYIKLREELMSIISKNKD